MIDQSRTLPIDDVATAPDAVREPVPDVIQAPAPILTEANHEPAAPYLPLQSSEQATDRWRQIQGEFVDDPRRSVAEAHALVSDLMQHIVDSFTSERAALEQQWSRGHNVSTEDLRVCLQRYRSFFSRLLPSVNGP